MSKLSKLLLSIPDLEYKINNEQGQYYLAILIPDKTKPGGYKQDKESFIKLQKQLQNLKKDLIAEYLATKNDNEQEN